MDDDLLLDGPWPPDLDPSAVPFKRRSVTVLRRHGFYEESSRFNSLSEADVAGWCNAGRVTIEDIRTTGNEAIRNHHDTVELRRRIDTDLAAVASEPWAPHIWHRDPRFKEFIPKGDSTVYDIATSGGAADRRFLWDRLSGLRTVVDAQAALSLGGAIAQLVEAVSGQQERRLDVLLAVTGLNGYDAISGGEAARQLKVSFQRIHQLVQQLHRGLERARPPQGLWLPQLETGGEMQWPSEYSSGGVEVARAILGPRIR